MPPRCSICANGHLKQVNKLLGENKSFRRIASLALGDEKHYRSVMRHAEHLGFDFQTVKAAKNIESTVDVHKECCEQLEFAKQLRIAAQNYLTLDDEIILLPQADEVEITYFDYDTTDDGKPKRKRAKLDAILQEIYTDGGKRADKWSIKHVDIRSFALDAIKTCDIVIDKFAKLGGDYQSDRTNDADRARELRSQLRSKAADAVIRELSSVIETLPDEYQARFSLDVESAYDEMITQLVGMDDDKLRELSLPFTKKDLMLLKS